MAKDFIVAIEIGSSKMTGVAGKKNADGSITVLAAVTENPDSCIRKGVVYKTDKTTQCLINIVSKIETALKTEVTGVYVGQGGQSVRSVKNTIVRDLPADTIVTEELVNSIMDANRDMIYPDYEILDVVTHEYKVGPQYQRDPVGIQADHIEGNFLNVLWRRQFARSLKKCFDDAGINVVDMYPSAIVLADSVLTEAEKRTGCLLVDLGAETTTVSVYYRDTLRHLAVIPLGSNNVTKDIESLQIDEEEAERLKLEYGCAYTEDKDYDKTKKYRLADDRIIDSIAFNEVVEARVKEIVENVAFQVPDEYAGKLLGGVILTGGGSNMPNIEKVFRRATGIDRVRTATMVNVAVATSNVRIVLPQDGTTCIPLGLIVKGNTNCAGNAIEGSLFGPDGKARAAANKAEAERKQREAAEAAEAERIQREAEEAEERRRQEEERKRGKLGRALRSFLNVIISGDPNETKE